MFTPPPSPQPKRTRALSPSEKTPLAPESPSENMPSHSPEEIKRRTGRRLRLAALTIPLALIVLTAYYGYTADPITQESFSSSPPLPSGRTWHGLAFDQSHSHSPPHKRHPEPAPQATSSGSTSSQGLLFSATPTSSNAASSSTTAVANQPIPTIPSAPPTLPTPFPQPFDEGIAQNFSSVTCSDFFANMTNSASFRSCRPFSLLLQSSSGFINAQSNLTLMNSIIWGTCNTTTSYSQCQSNMASFASQLKDACTEELKDLNTMAVSTLTALNAFQVMHDVGCSTDPTSNTYCYLDAVRSANPADSYYYQLPLGIPLPNSTRPTCSACSKGAMNIYASALENSTTASLLTDLQSSYAPSAQLSVQFCGADFAQTNLSNAASSLLSTSPSLLACIAGILVWMTLS
ncbi:hypothetical protein CVT26_012989 [Gymnopilus dilepis]|uniref:DUF7729 domain-containing protein n=1 Tax=Gymnopilus dilepis TaxID=231916 RepID=A0A409YPA2_9AGAR|nr:hypothetical protein CVT26_012989 [Gymnopilus dilepis]